MRALALILAAFAALISAPVAAQEFPALTGRVVDAANIIPDATEAELNRKLEELEAQTQRQLVIATIPDLQGYDIADYGYQLGRAWGIGDAERNDGALLIVAPSERKVRIEVGYGLEGYLTDALSSLIINNAILPRAREGDLAGGIVAGTDAIIQQLQLPEEEARAIAADAGKKRESDSGFPVGAIFWIAFILFFFVLPMLRGRRRRRRYRGKGRDFGDTVGDIILWEVGSAILRGALSGGDDWGGGGGGFGGGGFSGGGGSFGGGGASGGW
ncbi:TPM domain-containing protein [Altererythrobacter litoralis]|uniref:TPM domain-containing protein n=1 Tax=Altererythrobacter litoralis TaxID=3113904 RepID=A0ABU7GDE8_9SPHN|nr:TPM domain-containing protein [Erythrobacteraceae bacterium 1XM1-14]